jgi:hypothetical protein
MSEREDIQRTIQVDFWADPLGYVLYAFPWGVKGTALEKFPDGPDKWQREEFERLRLHIIANALRSERGEDLLPYYLAVASGHGIGKSCFVAWLILFFMSVRPRCRGVVTANTGEQLETKTWPELSKWHRLAINRDWFKWTATKFTCQLPDKDGKSQEENWFFKAALWSLENTEAFAGLHNADGTVVIINDEASTLPNELFEVEEGAMSDGEGFQFNFGNPTVNTGRFKQCFTGAFRTRYHHRHIDSREVKVTNKAKIAADIAIYGEDSDYTRVRIKGQFPRSSDKQFIPGDLVERAQSRELVLDHGAPLIMGVDVAMGGSNETVIRWRQGDDARSIPARRTSEGDTMVLANWIARAIDETNPDAAVFDAGGGGKQIADILKLRGYRMVHIVWFGAASEDAAWADKRTEMWARGRDWLPGGCLPQDQKLYDDLIGPEARPAGKQGEVTRLESKQEMLRRGIASPDDGDAHMLTFAVRVARADLRGNRRTASRNTRIADGVEEQPFGA